MWIIARYVSFLKKKYLVCYKRNNMLSSCFASFYNCDGNAFWQKSSLKYSKSGLDSASAVVHHKENENNKIILFGREFYDFECTYIK